jgi:hypothetical protein
MVPGFIIFKLKVSTAAGQRNFTFPSLVESHVNIILGHGSFHATSATRLAYATQFHTRIISYDFSGGNTLFARLAV